MALCFNKRLISVPYSIADSIILDAKTTPSTQTFSAGQGDAFDYGLKRTESPLGPTAGRREVLSIKWTWTGRY